jgi:sucrose-6-phosphate hydrolase SacC (GH32 family)
MYKWDYLGDLVDKNKNMRYESEDLSCPDMFKIGSKNMLLFISHNIGTQYYLGTFANDKFSIETHGRMNWPGGTFFAPEQLVDSNGRNIIWGWVLERKPKHLQDFGWSGIMSLPRVLTLSKNGELQIKPAEELKTIRVAKAEEYDIAVQPNSQIPLNASGTSLEIQVEISGGEKSEYGIKVFSSLDGREETIIKYDPIKKELIIDFKKSSIKGPVYFPAYALLKPQMPGFSDSVSEQRVPFELNKGEILKLHIFIDKSIIEVFANERQCITQVVYPELPFSKGVVIFSGDDAIDVKKTVVWKMAETNAY